MSTLRSQLSYANLTATLALFIALGGGAYAATLPRNSVGAKQLKSGAVERIKIKKNAVNDTKVQDESLSGADIREGTLGKVPAAAAADAAAHANSSAALDKLTYKSATAPAPATSDTALTVACDPGQHVVGGGVKLESFALGLLDDSYPDAGGTAWTVHVAVGATPTNATVYAICTTATAVG